MNRARDRRTSISTTVGQARPRDDGAHAQIRAYGRKSRVGVSTLSERPPAIAPSLTKCASRMSSRPPADCFPILLARTIHECRREVFGTEARRGCSHVRPTQAYWQSLEEAEREQPRRARGPDAGAGIHEWSGLGRHDPVTWSIPASESPGDHGWRPSSPGRGSTGLRRPFHVPSQPGGGFVSPTSVHWHHGWCD